MLIYGYKYGNIRSYGGIQLRTEQQILHLVYEDAWMMDILRAARSLKLPDWWVCAGFVRSKIWDTLHGFTTRTPLPDVDVVYFDADNREEETEKRLEAKLSRLLPGIPWSVKNEARMHLKNDLPPYVSSVDAISKFPETATALGLTLDAQDQLTLAAPCGIDDVLQLVLRPTPLFAQQERLALIYEQRIAAKNWQAVWNRITVFHIEH
ncbi:MAG: hypothetical protein K0Q59_392 [Paenibacillus sp.]|nr:hypothetical protein [Paenibacillus sp.]